MINYRFRTLNIIIILFWVNQKNFHFFNKTFLLTQININLTFTKVFFQFDQYQNLFLE